MKSYARWCTRLLGIPSMLLLTYGCLLPHSVLGGSPDPPPELTLARRLPSAGFISYAMAFSPDGLHLAVAEIDGSVVLWNLVTGTSLFTVHACALGPPGLLISPDGLSILTFCPQGCCVHLWSATDGTPVKTIQLACVVNVAWSPDGQWLAVQVKPNQANLRWRGNFYEVPITVLSLVTEERVASLPSKLGTGMMFTASGQLITTCAVGTSCMWEIPSGRQARLSEGMEGLGAICCDGNKILWNESYYVPILGFSVIRVRVHVFDLNTGLDKRLPVHSDIVAFAAAKDHVALRHISAKPAPILIYSIAQMKLVQKLSPQEVTRFAVFSPDGKILAVMDKSTIKIWRCG